MRTGIKEVLADTIRLTTASSLLAANTDRQTISSFVLDNLFSEDLLDRVVTNAPPGEATGPA